MILITIIVASFEREKDEVMMKVKERKILMEMSCKFNDWIDA